MLGKLRQKVIKLLNIIDTHWHWYPPEIGLQYKDYVALTEEWTVIMKLNLSPSLHSRSLIDLDTMPAPYHHHHHHHPPPNNHHRHHQYHHDH